MPVKGKKKEKLVMRRVSLATRKRQSQLSKERQGQDGKWESNKKKAGFRQAQRSSVNMSKLLMSVKERSDQELATTMKEAQRIAAALKATPNQAEAKLLSTVASLEKLQVTAKVLAKTLLPRVLLEACRHAPKAAAAANSLRHRWRQQFREEQLQRRDKASSPSLAVLNAKTSPPAEAEVEAEAEATASVSGSESYSDSDSGDSSSEGDSESEGEDGSEASESESAEEDAEMEDPGEEAVDDARLSKSSNSNSSNGSKASNNSSSSSKGKSSHTSPPPKPVMPVASTPSPASPPARSVATPQQKYPAKSTKQTMLTAFLKSGQSAR